MNRLKFIILAIILSFVISACQTIKDKTDAIVEKENKILSKYIGKSSNVLKTDLGDPSALQIFHEAGVEIGKLANRLFAMTGLSTNEMRLIGGIANCHEFLDDSLRKSLDSKIQYRPIIANNSEIMASIVKKYNFEKLASIT